MRDTGLTYRAYVPVWLARTNAPLRFWMSIGRDDWHTQSGRFTNIEEAACEGFNACIAACMQGA
jgi:hypothetical protein